MKLHILPRVVTTWKEFVETHPIRSIALDGYVKGEPRFNREGTHVNFNHHEDVNRLATRCTASQVSMAIMGGLLRIFTLGNTAAWVNDCDRDVCLAVWLLRNPERIMCTHSEPLISRIIFNTDMMDTCAGAYPIDPDDRIMEQMAWVFAPYTDARGQGKISHLNSVEMETIIDGVLDRISLYSIGQPQKPDIRYNVIGGGKDWKLVEEIGGDARTHMRAPRVSAPLLPIAARKMAATFTLSVISLPMVDSTYCSSIRSSIKSKTYRATTSGAEATTAADPLASAAARSVHRISPS